MNRIRFFSELISIFCFKGGKLNYIRSYYRKKTEMRTRASGSARKKPRFNFLQLFLLFTIRRNCYTSYRNHKNFKWERWPIDVCAKHASMFNVFVCGFRQRSWKSKQHTPPPSQQRIIIYIKFLLFFVINYTCLQAIVALFPYHLIFEANLTRFCYIKKILRTRWAGTQCAKKKHTPKTIIFSSEFNILVMEILCQLFCKSIFMVDAEEKTVFIFAGMVNIWVTI